MNALSVINGDAKWSIDHGDCLPWLRSLPAQCVDLIITSPPYEAARTYGIDFKLRGQDWVDWCAERFVECVRVCRGLVAWVIEGQTRKFRWSATPALLMADLHRRGIQLRKPPAFHRVGIPGSGGPDWLRNDYEFIVCAGPGGKFPYSDNTAMGHAPKWAPGGDMSHRLSNGERRNQWGNGSATTVRRKNGNLEPMGQRPSHQLSTKRGHATRGGPNGDTMTAAGVYDPPAKANPGNVIKCIVGGGVMGDKLCHENEAPFPESLAEFFVRSWSPVDGIVCDPFAGSGTSLAVAMRWQRRAIGCDIRQSQVELTTRRCSEVTPNMFV